MGCPLLLPQDASKAEQTGLQNTWKCIPESEYSLVVAIFEQEMISQKCEAYVASYPPINGPLQLENVQPVPLVMTTFPGRLVSPQHQAQLPVYNRICAGSKCWF